MATRDTVDTWVRAHGREHADEVAVGAATGADPADPCGLAGAHDPGDGLHVSAAGYRVLVTGP